MSEKEFRQQSEAAKQFMREMNKKADRSHAQNSPQQPNKENIKPKSQPPKTNNGFFLTDLLKNGDTALLLGLLLLLFSEDADKKLLFALVYILL